MSDFVPALAIFCIFGLPIAAWIIFRVFSFLERMEMIKRGMVPPPGSAWVAGSHRVWREWARTQQQQQGGYAAGPWQQQSQSQQPVPPRPAAWNPDDDAQTALFKGIRLTLIGFAILIGLSFIGGSHGFHGGPWLLGGLIPMFVGIAQIIIALLSGAQLPGVQPQTTVIPPGAPPPPPPPPGGFTPGASTPWQQAGRPPFEELSKPVQPPDLR